MYQSHGWWFPDADTHFVEMLTKNIEKGGGPTYQEPVRRASIELCPRREFAIDVGANVGLWTRDLCADFQSVLVFEPVAEFRECLHQNLNGATNLKISPMALGAEICSIDMIITPGNTGHSHVDTSSLGRGSIPMITLDEFCRTYNMPRIDYIKLDCEGYENKILQGAKETVLRDHPIMVVENKKHKDVGHTDIDQSVDTLLSWGAKILKTVNKDVIIGW